MPVSRISKQHRTDASHPVPSPAELRRRQREIRNGWSKAEARRRTLKKYTGNPQVDAMICFLDFITCRDAGASDN
ncbi:MAG: hypothetical protein KDA88_09690 [Planctomycetaceae bacterium]|nr:hypothetical protein [Planctomycetaceae bacterium]MCA9029180.1 hypothetical protein [Planctomycetaceae bacterium]MCB9952403.1 hypothetical protein [Planctomycetaceae bacterium]